MISTDSLSDTEVVARTLWAEARNQGEAGMVAVACVIQNRARNPGWWGHDLRSVCLARRQFSCWNASDPQAKLIRAEAIHDRIYPLALAIASEAVAQRLADVTHGADHYCTKAVAGQTSWAKGRTPVYTCGSHLFFKIGLTA